jgi:hypothetical protein
VFYEDITAAVTTRLEGATLNTENYFSLQNQFFRKEVLGLVYLNQEGRIFEKNAFMENIDTGQQGGHRFLLLDHGRKVFIKIVKAAQKDIFYL